MVNRFLDLILDARESKPSFSKSLLQLDCVDGAIANLLPLASASLADTNLISKVSRKLSEGGEDAANIRTVFANILEDTLILSEHYRDDEARQWPLKYTQILSTLTDAIVNVPCMQLLDASLKLIPISQLIESLQGLLARTEGNVSNIPSTRDFTTYPLQIRQQALRSFGHRLNDNKFNLEASQAECLAFLPRLAQIIEESSDVSLKKTAVVCIDRIAELFGKKDIPAIVASARVVAGSECLGASESGLRTISMLCLATMVELSSNSFISILPLALPKAVDSLATSIREDTEDGALHNAVYSLIGALILYVPWMVTGADLVSILKLSFESANAEMGDGCDQSRVGALRLLARRIEAKDCFAALTTTWMDAMAEGPMVSPKTGL